LIAQLFTTLGCHLCEQAHELLLSLTGQGMELRIELIEIVDSAELMDRYGITIPVIQVEDREICWPFSIDELRAFLENET
tara:strand:- start:261 stop:500 length:240 start_codon:yes stop_codon:yes gene_type:complete